MSNTVITETIGAVLSITLNRPERLNALDTELLTALNAAFDEATNETYRAVLLTGAGRGFCAGADLAQNLGMSGEMDAGAMIDAYYNPLVQKMRALPKPILAAVNGVAAGAGMNLALGADIIIAAQSASFTQAFIRIGLMPDAGGTYFLPRIVGEHRARAMAMLGETLSAEQALTLGLVWRLFPDDHFAAEAATLAQSLAAKPTRALAAMKQAFNASAQNDMTTQLELERDLQRALGHTSDFKAGVTAFLQKKPPIFEGK
jgi:2-(1,2-epoxy-1,2-dihydrophenyl)acetyl-CoA isomerase